MRNSLVFGRKRLSRVCFGSKADLAQVACPECDPIFGVVGCLGLTGRRRDHELQMALYEPSPIFRRHRGCLRPAKVKVGFDRLSSDRDRSTFAGNPRLRFGDVAEGPNAFPDAPTPFGTSA